MDTEKYSELIIRQDASLIDALKQMDATRKKLLLVFDHDHFRSLISIGDIQRAIIRNNPLDAPIHTILRKEIKVAFEDEKAEDVRARMLQYRTECMPILDRSDNLVRVVFWDEVFGEKHADDRKVNIPVVIMAGGMGTRLKPLTNILPKPLIPIGEKTILETILDGFYDIGCSDFILSVNYKADMIRYYLENLEPKKGYNIRYVQEEKPLGTGGSLSLLRGKISGTFFVSNCDILIDQNLYDIYHFHAEQKNEMTIVAALKHFQIPYGTIDSGENGELLRLTEKPELTFKINSGLYILESHLIDEIPENTFFHITDLIDKILARNGRIGVFPVSEGSWKDIGDWAVYSKWLVR